MIRESFFELREGGFANDVLGGIEHQGNDAIIGDRKSAIAFAQRKLVHDIPELSNYELVDYLPGVNSEQWMFDADTAGEHVNTITIKHINKNGSMVWNFIFGQAVKSMEAMTAEVRYRTGHVADYDAFVEKVNSDWQLWG